MLRRLHDKTERLSECARRAALDLVCRASVDDESSAFRQKPTCEEDANFLISAYYDRDCGEVRFVLMYGHPFGLGAAVHNYNRCPELQVAIMRQLAAILSFHFYDDNLIIDTSLGRNSSQWLALQLFELMLRDTFSKKAAEAA